MLLHSQATFIEFERGEIEQSISDRFEKQVERFPGSLAVKTRNHRFTYRQLDQEANRVRQALLRMRGEGEERIALLLEHDAPMIAALLGVLKSGKTYVPLDPSYPRERLLYILKDSQASAIVSNRENQGLANQLAQDRLPIIYFEDLGDLLPDEASRVSLSPDTAAYILYTSGSTGQPKGVVQNHRNVLYHIRNYTNNLRISVEDRMSLVPSYSFDAAVMDIYGALLNGASLHPFDLKRQGFDDLAVWLNKEGITVYHSTPTVYRYLLRALRDGKRLPKMRFVVLGGEEVVKRDVEQHRRHFSKNCILVNGLGPTESTLALQYFINFETKIINNCVPVGYPVEGTEILLLNEDGDDSVEYGEIAIRSAHLATGYWRKPELTGKVFLPDPEGHGRRLYRTGDLGRLLPNGSLEFLGRKDFQVKLRGFRIELGEIEAVLAQHAEVKEVVVVARDNVRGEKCLVAYFVSQQVPAPKARELRTFLERRLPAHMVPERFVVLGALPLTPNGKIDRLALPALDGAELEDSTECRVSARDETEKVLVSIWEDKLKVHPIGVRDNFFSLGGHSILAAQIFKEIAEQFSRQLPLSMLLQTPTIEGIARVLQERDRDNSLSILVPIQPQGTKPPLYLIHGIGGNILNFCDLGNRLGPDQPVYGVQSQGLDGKKPVLTRVEDMAAVYVEEIRRFQTKGPYYLGGMSFGGRVAFEIARQLHAQGQSVALLALLDSCPSGYARLLRQREGSIARAKRILGKVNSHWEALSAVPRGKRWEYVAKKVRTLQRRVKSKLWQNIYHLRSANVQRGNKILQNVKEANILASDMYLCKSYPGHVTVFRAMEESIDDVDPAPLWRQLAKGGVTVHATPGNHITLLSEPHVSVLAEELKKSLEKAQAAQGNPELTPTESARISAQDAELKLAW